MRKVRLIVSSRSKSRYTRRRDGMMLNLRRIASGDDVRLHAIQSVTRQADNLYIRITSGLRDGELSKVFGPPWPGDDAIAVGSVHLHGRPSNHLTGAQFIQHQWRNARARAARNVSCLPVPPL